MVLRRGGRRQQQAEQHEQEEQQQPPAAPSRQRGGAPSATAAASAWVDRATSRVSRWARLPPDAARLLLTAAAVRVALIAWGELQDRLSPDVKYTDTDYGVFTDAARSVWRGDGDGDGASPGRLLRGTPFARATYRYSPLLAYAVLPNLLVGVFGKLLFSAADLVAGVQCYRLAAAAMGGGGGEGRAAASNAAASAAAAAAGWWAAAAWLFNPFTATVSTRGSCDSLAVVMLLGLLQLLLALGPVAGGGAAAARRATATNGNSLTSFLAGVLRDLPASFRAIAPAALLYGLAVHFRIYPIIYAPSTVLFLARRRATAATASAALPSSSQQQQQQQQNQRRGGTSSSSRSPAARSAASTVPPTALRAFLHGLLTDGAAFGLVSGGAFLALGLAFFALYGRQFLHEAFLHHMGRLDPRHNFSAYFYPIYLRHFGGLAATEGELGAGGAAAATAVDPARWAGAPQVAVLLSVAAALHAHLPLAWLISTVAFVALNKVSTAQYFVWYFCLLPAALPHLLRWRNGAEEVESGEEAAVAATTSKSRGRAAANGTAAAAGRPAAAVPTPIVPRPLLYASACWALLQLHWLAWGYAVEFAGRGAFLGLWGASAAFLAANAWLAAALVREYRPPAKSGSFVAMSLAIPGTNQ